MCFPFPPGICSVVSMLKAKKCGGEGKFQLITEFAKNSKLKVILSCSQCSLGVLPECHRC